MIIFRLTMRGTKPGTSSSFSKPLDLISTALLQTLKRENSPADHTAITLMSGDTLGTMSSTNQSMFTRRNIMSFIVVCQTCVVHPSDHWYENTRSRCCNPLIILVTEISLAAVYEKLMDFEKMPHLHGMPTQLGSSRS